MRHFFIAISLGFLFATQGFALHETNCSDARGSLKRIETEIWGSNSIVWTLDEMEIWSIGKPEKRQADVYMKENTQIQISGDSGNGIFVVNVAVRFKNEADSGKNLERTVICNSWSDDRLD
ncbi:MAG: hypothetical protein JKY15_08300 [Deltaproteobacteria bacterium]|nr:hypothetical protein [Deltaproteobacteria bacterium]